MNSDMIKVDAYGLSIRRLIVHYNFMRHLKHNSGLIFLSLVMILWIGALLGGSQLARPMPHIYIADKYPGGVGKIFGSARMAEVSQRGYLMRVPEIRIDSGVYEVRVFYESQVSNFELEICKDQTVHPAGVDRNWSMDQKGHAIIFGKHFQFMEDQSRHPQSCSEKLPYQMEKTNDGMFLAHFEIASSEAYSPIDIRVRYSGDGALTIKRVVLNQGTALTKHLKMLSAFSVGVVVAAVILLIFYILRIGAWGVRNLLLLLLPSVGVLSYYLVCSLDLSFTHFTEHLLYLFGISFVGPFLIIIYKKDALPNVIKRRHRHLLALALVLTFAFLFFKHTLFTPAVTFRLKTSTDITMKFYFDYGDGEGFYSEDVKIINVRGDDQFQDIEFTLPGNSVENVFASISGAVPSKIYLQSVVLWSGLESREIVAKHLYNALMPLNNLEMSLEETNLVRWQRRDNTSSFVELANYLFIMNTQYKQNVATYGKWFLIIVWALVLVVLFKNYSHSLFCENNIKREWVLVILSMMVLGVSFILSSGPVRTTIYSQDLFTIFDGLWRELKGVHMHSGYNAGLYGPLMVLPVWFGHIIDGHTAYIYTYGNILVLMTVTTAALVMSYQRLSTLGMVFFSLFLALVVVGVHALGIGEGHHNFTQAMSYNRQGFAMESLLALLLFFEPHDDRIVEERRITGVGIGVLLAIMFYLKLSYFLFGMIMVVAAVVMSLDDLKIWVSAVVTFVCCFVLGLWYLDFQLPLMLSDYWSVIKVAGDEEGILTKLYPKSLSAALEFLPILLILICTAIGNYFEKRCLYRLLVSIVAMLVAGLLLLASNYQFFEVPLFVVASLFVTEMILVRALVNSNEKTRLLRLWAITFGVLLFINGGTIYKHVYHMVDAFVYKTVNFPKSSEKGRYVSTYLSDAIVDDGDTAGSANEGFLALLPYLKGGLRVFSLSHNNSFNYSLKLDLPAKPMFHFWHYNYNFSIRNHPAPAEVFNGIDIVMVKKRLTFLNRKLRLLYFDFVIEKFDLVDDDYKHWSLFIRRNQEV